MTILASVCEVSPCSFVWHWFNNYWCGLSFHVLLFIILHLVRTIYLFNLASWKLALFGIFSSDLPQDISWGQVSFTCPLGLSFTSFVGLVTVMSPLASVLRCIYWSEPANYFLPLLLYFLVTMNFFSKTMRLFLFCEEVYLYPCLDSTESNILNLSFSISLTSLSMIISSFFLALFHPSLRLSNIALCTCTAFSAFIHLSLST